jgi:hypothetical protein
MEKESLKESIRRTIEACVRIPELAQREAIKGLTTVSRSTLGQEKTIAATEQVMSWNEWLSL